ncbi:hypothetical protein BQ8482_170023 [Mesorhizobium delmotii]|uniref:Uncharacterized protein n=1 Tax=Mesorhizobium delmotii TaxID=1631247 RepID=A0A2P9AHQ7_9HYPH|nr:hypothetical protein BQ8482_170023 [Mesorhizobium delmotii]
MGAGDWRKPKRHSISPPCEKDVRQGRGDRGFIPAWVPRPHQSGGEVARRSRDGEGEPRPTKAPSPAASRPPLPRFAGARNPGLERFEGQHPSALPGISPQGEIGSFAGGATIGNWSEATAWTILEHPSRRCYVAPIDRGAPYCRG